jgi:hypothetical protein
MVRQRRSWNAHRARSGTAARPGGKRAAAEEGHHGQGDPPAHAYDVQEVDHGVDEAQAEDEEDALVDLQRVGQRALMITPTNTLMEG